MINYECVSGINKIVSIKLKVRNTNYLIQITSVRLSPNKTVSEIILLLKLLARYDIC